MPSNIKEDKFIAIMDNYYDNRPEYYQNKLEELEKEQRKLNKIKVWLFGVAFLIFFIIGCMYIYCGLNFDVHITFRTFSVFAFIPFLPFFFFVNRILKKDDNIKEKIEHVKKAIEEENIKTEEKTRDAS